MKKLWMVDVSVEFVVFADGLEEAKKMALANAHDECAESATAYEINGRDLPYGWMESYPYGDDEGRNCREILEATPLRSPGKCTKKGSCP